MALHDRQFRVTFNRAQDRHIGVVLDDGAQLGLMTRSTQLIQDDPGDAQLGIKGLIAEDQRCDAARHPLRVEHEDDREIEQMRQGSIAVAAIDGQAVIQTLVAFDQRYVRYPGGKVEATENLLLGHEVQVEIEASPTAGLTEPHRVDVIRSLLERLNNSALGAQGGAQTRRDDGLARRFVCS